MQGLSPASAHSFFAAFAAGQVACSNRNALLIPLEYFFMHCLPLYSNHDKFCVANRPWIDIFFAVVGTT